jgi:hypothetical protein
MVSRPIPRCLHFVMVLAMMAFVLMASPVSASPAPPQGTQSDSSFAASYAANNVTNVAATKQQTSCYRPEVPYFGTLNYDGYTGMSICNNAATTGENIGDSPYPTQAGSSSGYPAAGPMLVKDHSESDIRVDPTNPKHLIGQSKWFVSAEGYNHLLGFYESFDGGKTWSVQGHVPGYEGWTDNTDPVGTFDGFGNFYSLVLPYQFSYNSTGGHVFNNGSSLPNPSLPGEAIAAAVRPAGSTNPNQWITTHNGQPDYLMTAPNAVANDPDKQWIVADTNPNSPHYNRVYAMWTLFAFDPSSVFVSYADAHADGTHTDWSTPVTLPTINGKPWDSYLLPHVTPDGTVYTTVTNNPAQQGFSSASIYLVYSRDGGATWQGPLPVTSNIAVPTYQNTTFREGIVNSFAVGTTLVNGKYPLYASWEDGSSGVSNLFLSASYDNGQSWTTPILVNDNVSPVDELQSNLNVAPNGTVSVAFYDRRLACPAQGTTEAAGAGLALDTTNSNYSGALPPYGATNYCVNSAIQFYTPMLQPIGHNIRLSAHTWDPQLNSAHPYGITVGVTFIGDYFGNTSNGPFEYTTSVSTFNDGSNPSFYQQQVVARVAVP